MPAAAAMRITGPFFEGVSAGGRAGRIPAVRPAFGGAGWARVPDFAPAVTGLSAPCEADLTAPTRSVVRRVGATGTFSVATFGAGGCGAAATRGSLAVGAFAETAG